MSIVNSLGELGRFSIALLTISLPLIVPLLYLLKCNSGEHARRLQRTHTKTGIPSSKSNLRGQSSTTQQTTPSARLQSLFIYPVKSCRGVELQHSRVLPTGLEFDRLYTFAQLREPKDEDEGKDATRTWQFLTQRQAPLLANVKVDLWLPDPSKTRGKDVKLSGGYLVVRFPWTNLGPRGLLQTVSAKLKHGLKAEPEREFLLPLDFPSAQDISSRSYEHADVKIWKEVTTALNVASEVPPELKAYLGLKNRLGLFRMDPSRQREVFRCAPRKEAAGYQPIVDFHDAVRRHSLGSA